MTVSKTLLHPAEYTVPLKSCLSTHFNIFTCKTGGYAFQSQTLIVYANPNPLTPAVLGL